jgi:hypothetical protein
MVFNAPFNNILVSFISELRFLRKPFKKDQSLRALSQSLREYTQTKEIY